MPRHTLARARTLARHSAIAIAVLIALLALAALYLRPGAATVTGAYYDCGDVRRSGESETAGAGALMVAQDVQDLTDASNIVVSGRVESLQSCRSTGPVGIVTLVTIAPDGVLEAQAFPAGPLTVEVSGGALEGYRLAVGDSPEFTVGERGVFFLDAEAGVIHPAGGFESKLPVTEDGTVVGPDVPLTTMQADVAQASASGLANGDDPMAGGPQIIESSYSLIGPWFQDDDIPVPVNINPNSNRPSQLTAQQARMASIHAFHTWQNLPGSYISFGPISDTTRTSVQGDCDGNFDVTFGIPESHSSGTLAITYTCYIGNTIVDADEEIDTDHFGSLWRVDGSGSCNSGVYDLETVLLHETGHFLGLGHPSANGGCGSCPVMDASYGGVQRTPCQDDIDGVTHLYPLAVGSPPGAPTALLAVPGNNVSLSWTNVANEWGYEVWRASGALRGSGHVRADRHRVHGRAQLLR